MAVATVGLVVLGGSRRAAADIEVYVQATGSPAQAFDITNNTAGSTPVFSIDGYTTQITTVVTNYPGNPSLGTISTTIDILGAVTSPVTLTTTVMLVSAFTGSLSDPLLKWSAPITSPVSVSSASSFTSNTTVTSGLATTTTYYNSGPAATFAVSTPVVSSSQNNTNTTGNSGPNLVLEPNSGTYTLSQQIMLTGLNSGAEGFNYGGTSSVASPEPSSLAIVGIGALGMIGYGLRRRKALGA